MPDSAAKYAGKFEGLDARQAHAMREWDRLREDAPLPLRATLRPEKLGEALPASMLLHVEHEHGAPVFYQRIEGQLVVAAFGEGLSQRIDDIYTSSHVASALPDLIEAVENGRVILSASSTDTEEGAAFSYTRLILPFIEADGHVSRLLLVFSFDGRALARRLKPLPVRQSPTTLYLRDRLSA